MQFDEPALYQQYGSVKRLNNGGNLFIALSIPATITGIICLIGGDDSNDSGMVTTGTVLTAAGVAFLAVGIPMKSIAGRKMNNVLDTYRRMYYSTQSTPHFQLNMYGNGLGLAYVF
jgi:hypothetical protein